jgi:hypothetical protein
MKKALGGCLAAAVVLLVLGGASLWFLVIKPAAVVADRALEGAREGIAQVTDLGRTVARMRELEAGVRTPGPYAAPADGHLTAAQVDRFLAVQAAVLAALGPATAVPDAPAGDLAGAVAEAAGALRALARLGDAGLAAKQAQVDALNAQSMSLDEYRWVRERASEVLVAGGVSMAVAGAGAAGGEVLGRAGETAQQLGEAARQATDAATAAADAARRAAQAARDAWQGKPPAESAPQPPADEPSAPAAGDAPPAASAPLPGASTDPRLVDFPLVAPHAEAFIRARALAAIGL